jgi:hypothetical protein
MMKKAVIFLFLSVFVHFTYAQQGFQSYADGAPATLIVKTDVEGTELLYDKWLPANIQSVNGKVYQGVMVKYNLLEDVAYFLGKGDVTMIFSTPIKQFTIEDKENNVSRTFRTGFPNFNGYNGNTFYEVLVDGDTKLLKKQHKKITESRAYNSATLVKKIVDNVSYFMFANNILTEVKRDKKFFQSFAGSNANTLMLLNDKSINLKKEEDLIKVVKTFN